MPYLRPTNLMDKGDIDLRNVTYGRLRTLGRAPTAGEVARAARVGQGGRRGCGIEFDGWAVVR